MISVARPAPEALHLPSFPQSSHKAGLLSSLLAEEATTQKWLRNLLETGLEGSRPECKPKCIWIRSPALLPLRRQGGPRKHRRAHPGNCPSCSRQVRLAWPVLENTALSPRRLDADNLTEPFTSSCTIFPAFSSCPHSMRGVNLVMPESVALLMFLLL